MIDEIKIMGELPKLMDGFVANILTYAVILAAVATITMTFQELIKSFFKLRCRFHESRVKNWINDEKTYQQLIVLSVADVKAEDALFDQATDKLMAQIQSAANIVIDFPDRYQLLFKLLTANPLTSDENLSDANIWNGYISKKTIAINDPTSVSTTEAENQAAIKARASIDHFVTRRLDAFQTQTEYIWARRNQYYSVAGASLLLIFLLIKLCVPVLWAIPLGVFGGMISPFAKDIVSGLSGLKTK